MGYWSTLLDQKGWRLVNFFLSSFLYIYKKRAQKTRPISSHLDPASLVNKGFIIHTSYGTQDFCRDSAGILSKQDSPSFPLW